VKLVTSKDEELLQTVHFFGKFPNREASFLKTLEIAFHNDFATKEMVLTYGYFQFHAIFRMVRGNDLNEINLDPILEAYNRAIAIDPDYWLAKVCKAILFLTLPPQKWIETEMAHVIGRLIEQQKKAPKMEPYFVIPYLIYSDFCFTLGNVDQALEILHEGKRNVALEPMAFRFFNEFFGQLLKDYYNRLIFSKETKISDLCGELGRTLFPAEEVFRQTLNNDKLVSKK
jgi:tetratricopeptide (TPR) repeat protein